MAPEPRGKQEGNRKLGQGHADGAIGPPAATFFASTDRLSGPSQYSRVTPATENPCLAVFLRGSYQRLYYILLMSALFIIIVLWRGPLVRAPGRHAAFQWSRPSISLTCSQEADLQEGAHAAQPQKSMWPLNMSPQLSRSARRHGCIRWAAAALRFLAESRSALADAPFMVSQQAPFNRTRTVLLVCNKFAPATV